MDCDLLKILELQKLSVLQTFPPHCPSSLVLWGCSDQQRHDLLHLSLSKTCVKLRCEEIFHEGWIKTTINLIGYFNDQIHIQFGL